MYCDVGEGCKYAAENMLGNNGIAKGKNDTFYVANARSGQLRVMEAQADNTLVLTDVIPTGKFENRYSHPFETYRIADRTLDNVSVDEDGVVWAAGGCCLT